MVMVAVDIFDVIVVSCVYWSCWSVVLGNTAAVILLQECFSVLQVLFLRFF